MSMDKRVNCMACLVADEEGMLAGAVATVGVITHALARTGGARQTAHHLCAFNVDGVLKSEYWKSRVEEENIIWAADSSAYDVSPADQEPDARGPLGSSDP